MGTEGSSEVMWYGLILHASEGRADRVCWLARYEGRREEAEVGSVISEMGKTEEEHSQEGQEFGLDRLRLGSY